MSNTKYVRALLRDLAILNMGDDDKTRFWDRVEKGEDGCWRFKSALRRGYASFWYNGDTYIASRASLIWSVGKIYPDLMACHLCRARDCVRPIHLYFGTAQDNMQDRHRDGTYKRGDEHHSRKITSETAMAIAKALNDQSRSAQYIAKQFGVTRSIVKNIGSGKGWSHLPTPRQRRGLKGVRKEYGDKGHPQSVLTEENVMEIRRQLMLGIRGCVLAKAFGVSERAISAIKNRSTWAHLEDEQRGRLQGRARAASLQPKQVAHIKKVLLETGGRYGVASRLAEEYGTTRFVISMIKRGKSFASVCPAE